MINPIRSAAHRAGRWYVRQVCRSEAESQSFRHHNERPLEYGFALGALAKHRPKTVLDVGTGTTAWPNLLRNCGFVVTAIDNVTDYWDAGMVNRHWTVLDVDITKPGDFAARRFEAITCISVLEHIVDHEAAVRQMACMLEKGGLLILTCPYNHSEFCDNVYQRPDALYGKDAPYICRSYSLEQMQRWLSFGLTLEQRELWKLFNGPVWATGERIQWERVESETQPHQLGCFLLRKI
jgi:2-polyprenyl-3-methyl-5-hydroxy-6-metoxy-1,4-benzoquinol methylase